MKKRWYFIPFAFFLACLVLAGIDRFSYQNAGADIYSYSFDTTNTLNSAFHEFSATNADQLSSKLIQNADSIVTAEYDGNRTVTGEGFYSQVTVRKVYKGGSALTGKKIIILENVVPFTFTRYINPGAAAYLPLQQGDQYVLLLKKVRFDPARKLNDFENSQYYPITQTATGAYRLSKTKQTKLFNWDKKQESLNSLKGYDLPVQDQKQLELYYQLRESVFQKLKISL